MDSCHDHSRQKSPKRPQKSIRKKQVPQFTRHQEPSQPQEESHKIQNPEIAYIFNPQRDHLNPYHLDGDTSMYTASAITQRNLLKSEPIVVDSIKDFISLYSSNLGVIARAEYQRMYQKICDILRPNLEPLEKKKMMDDDWIKDAQGNSSITKQQLFESLFELCDIWCPNIDPLEYKTFFDQLKFRIRYEGLQDRDAYDILHQQVIGNCEKRGLELLLGSVLNEF